MAFLTDYRDSAWRPAAALVMAAIVALATSRLWPTAIDWALLGFTACALATGALALFQVFKHGLRRGALTGCAAVLIGGAGVLLLLALGVSRAVFDESEDPFGRDLQVPKTLRMREPRGRPDDEAWDPVPVKPPTEPWSLSFHAACATPPATPSTRAEVALTRLSSFQDPAGKDRLLAYLSSGRLWHITQERGRRYAYRRFTATADPPANSLNGYYSGEGCQFRVILGLDGAAMAAPWLATGDATVLRADAGVVEVLVRPATNEGRFSSYLVVEDGEFAVEIYDEAKTRGRALTALALELIDEDLGRAERGERQPPSGVPGPGLELTRGFQGGLYLVTAEVNPGEPGTAYLRAFEHVRNTRLSESRLTARSRATIGWSKDPAALFHYEADITIYEGDWGVYYPGRFELWFEPASGAPERKLVEDIFRIEGWQR